MKSDDKPFFSQIYNTIFWENIMAHVVIDRYRVSKNKTKQNKNKKQKQKHKNKEKTKQNKTKTKKTCNNDEAGNKT